MGKKSTVALTALVLISSTCFLLYSHYIGFERKPLADKFPANTWAYASVRHFKKAFLSFISNEELAAVANIAKAISFTLAGGDTDEPERDPKIDPELWDKLSGFIKTQVAIAVLEPPKPNDAIPDIALAAYVYGDTKTLQSTLSRIATQASTPNVSYSWTQNNFEGHPYHTLTSDPLAPESAPPISWTVIGDVLLAGTSPSVIETLLLQSSKASVSLSDKIAAHKTQDHLESPDLSLYFDAKQTLEYAENKLTKKLSQAGSLYSSFSTKTFFQEIGLYDFDSFFLSQKLTGEQTTYSSLTYTNVPKIINAFVPGENLLHHRHPEFPVLASNFYHLKTGTAIETTKNALFKAAPLLAFAYIGLQAKLYSETGEQLDSIIADAFSSAISTLHTIDIGTSPNLAGDIREQLVLDIALKVRLTEQSDGLLNLIETQSRSLLKDHQPLAYYDGDTFHFDQFSDKSLTAGRFALNAEPDYLTIGYGTLKSFYAIKSREEVYPFDTDGAGPHAPTIGTGLLTLEALPSTLYEFATIFYQQINPGKGIPNEFFEFDWTTLSVLEQVRESRLHLTGDGQIYRVSKKRR